jgi:hypothetical protein
LALLLTFFVTLGWSLPLFSPQTLHLYNGGVPGPLLKPCAELKKMTHPSWDTGGSRL